MPCAPNSPGARRVTVVGGGLIGARTAPSCVGLGQDVTVVEAAPLPLVPQLGPEMAALCAALHRRGRLAPITGTGVARLHGAPTKATGTTGTPGTATPPGRAVIVVEPFDDRVLPADTVLVGTGATPGTDRLAGSELALRDGVLRDGVLCEDGCATALPQVVAVGDVARVGGHRAGPWTSAMEQLRVPVRNLLAGHTAETVRSLPYFRYGQYGVRLQFAGGRHPTDTVRCAEGALEDGAPAEGGLPAVYGREGADHGGPLRRPPSPVHADRA